MLVHCILRLEIVHLKKKKKQNHSINDDDYVEAHFLNVYKKIIEISLSLEKLFFTALANHAKNKKYEIKKMKKRVVLFVFGKYERVQCQ